MYRSNFHTPLLVEPDGAGNWIVVVPTLKVGEATPYRIKPGTALAFFSDGFIDGSRQYSRLIKFISNELPSFDGKASSLRELFAAFNAQNLDRPNDDRTLVVVSWRREEYLKSLKISA